MVDVIARIQNEKTVVSDWLLAGRSKPFWARFWGPFWGRFLGIQPTSSGVDLKLTCLTVDGFEYQMKTSFPLFLLSLVFVGQGFCPSRAAEEGNAQVWLVLMNNVSASTTFSGTGSDALSLIVVPMQTMEGCESEGNRWRNSKSKFRKGFREFYCLENR